MKYSTDTYALRQQKTELFPPSTRGAILCNFIEKVPILKPSGALQNAISTPRNPSTFLGSTPGHQCFPMNLPMDHESLQLLCANQTNLSSYF